MRSALPAFCVGVLCSHLLPALPASAGTLALTLAGSLLVMAVFAAARCGWPVAALAGLAWVALRGFMALPAPLPPELHGMALVLSGRIGPVVTGQDGLRRFRFDADPVRAGALSVNPGRLQLYWYAPAQSPLPGERWQLAVRLRPLRATANPGGFDRERYALVQRIAASGSVIASPRNQRLAASTGLQRLRNRVAAGFAGDDGLRHASLLTTLVIGNAARIAPAQRRLLQDSGTAHLLAISGLHLSMVAGIGFALARAAWSTSLRACARMPAHFHSAIHSARSPSDEGWPSICEAR